jgi:hypothetical protein
LTSSPSAGSAHACRVSSRLPGQLTPAGSAHASRLSHLAGPLRQWGGVTDEAWANAPKQYDDDQLASLVSLIALINSYNRINVITRQPGGDYQPGQWG